MKRNQHRDEREPWMVLGGVPVYSSTALVGLYGSTLLLGVLAGVLGLGSEWLAVTQFSLPSALGKVWVWQYLSYPVCNRPSVWFVLEMFLLYRFGREIEEFLGRRIFLRLYLLQVLAPPLCLTGLHLLLSILGGSSSELGLSGSAGLHFAVFFAYAAVFPGVSVLFGLKAIWVAVILLVVYSLERLALMGSGNSAAAWGELLVLWVGSVGGALYATWEKGIWEFRAPPWMQRHARKTPVQSSMRWAEASRQFFLRVTGVFKKRPRFEVVRNPLDSHPGQNSQSSHTLEGMECEELLASIDPLLEKISRSGLASLTSKERLQLEAARAELMKKETARR